jgi:hypothetical protein
MSLSIVPLTLKKANDLVVQWHRHHGPCPPGLPFFQIGVIDETGTIRGVAIVARPPNRNSDDGLTCEVVRVATDGARNACSALYGASARVARLMGFHRIITYTLDDESGASLRAVGWSCEKRGIKSYWQSHQSNGRTVKARAHYQQTKTRWVENLIDLIEEHDGIV